MKDVFIGLGSNLASPTNQLKLACRYLADLPESTLVKCSNFYRSQPLGPQDQPSFVNAVVWLKTQLAPEALLNLTQTIESQQGRQRKAERWGPRTLDLDILLFGELTLNSERLTVPHYGMKQREFVLYPLFEIVPDLVLPDGESLSALVQKCPRNGLQRLN